MRKINPHRFSLARRSSTRDINRQIALNLIREHQPISRADLARRMKTTRGFVGVLVNDLISEALVYEGNPGRLPRGRRPVSLYVRTRDRLVVAADVRSSRIHVMLCDFGGREIALQALEPVPSPDRFIREFPDCVRALLKKYASAGQCEGIGIVVPGIVDRDSGRVINAPPLGWRDVEIREPLVQATGLPVVIEAAGKACALAEMWLGSDGVGDKDDFVYLSISDGVGAGVVVGGELIRGQNQLSGEFGHVQLSMDGPLCACGARGCWMAYVSNLATIARFIQARNADGQSQPSGVSVTDIIDYARAGDKLALATILDTARYLGLGLVTVMHTLDPSRIYIGGEIIAAWDLIEGPLRAAIAERTLAGEAVRTVVQPSKMEHPRLRGAAALFAAPTFAVPNLG